MTVFWPFALLLLPLAVTMLRGRTLWIWATLLLGLVVVGAALQYIVWDIARGGTGWPFRLDASPAGGDGYTIHTLYAPTFSFSLGRLLFPTACITLVLILCRAHPRRSPLDVVLFWGTSACWIALQSIPLVFSNAIGMPSRYADYKNSFAVMNSSLTGLSILFLVLIAVATLRPVVSSLHARKAAYAL